MTLLPDMRCMIASVFADIEAARRHVCVECYIIRDDTLGRALGAVLMRAAARGVATRVIYDPLGSQKTDHSFFDMLRARGVKVRAYRDIQTVYQGASPAPRNHSRVIVADDAAYTGGAAWADDWLPRDRGGGGWRDLCCRVTGPIVTDFQRLFDLRWAESRSHRAHPADYDTGGRYRELRLVSDSPHRESLVYLRHMQAFLRATRRIWMASPYFFAPPPMIVALSQAARRGVDVRVILTGPTDLRILKHAALAELPHWLDAGLKVYEYQDTVFHAKYALVDDDWATVGTFNANPSSIGLANETNLLFHDPEVVARLGALFLEDQGHALEMTRARARRPFFKRIVDEVARDILNLADLIWGPPVRLPV